MFIGDFVIEYVGEIINEDEYKKRLNQMHINNEENFYFLTIDKDRLLDAGPKGNVARYVHRHFFEVFSDLTNIHCCYYWYESH